MNKNPYKLIVRYEMERPFPTWDERRVAILECGHRVPNPTDRQKKCACQDCGLAKRRAERARMEALRR